MKILAVSDEESPALWEHYMPGRLDAYDLILACGDLKPSYLTFLVTMARCRLLYVPGNHDEGYEAAPPEGCSDIDGHLVVCGGLRILGLGGCLRYHPGPHQYSQRQMRDRVRRLRGALKKAGGVDVVITHAPPRGVGDLEDPAHQGFEAFLELMDEWKPEVLLHGHTHLRYGNGITREQRYGCTRVINVSERYVLDLPDRPVTPESRRELLWITKHKEPEFSWHSGV